MGTDSKTEQRLQELVEEYKKSGDEYAVENPRALKIHVKRDLTEHRNVV
jgi:hypothetical protein